MHGKEKVQTQFADDLTGSPGELKADPVMDSFQKQSMAMQNFGQSADRAVIGHLQQLSGVGAMQGFAGALADAARSKTDLIANGPKDDGLPNGPGFAYVTHLFKRLSKAKMDKERGSDKRPSKEETSIYSEHLEAVKTAIQQMGVYSDRNPGGLPIDLKEARKLWFGDKDVDQVKEAEWRSLVEMGDRKLDTKRIRKFVNYDGSLTWEILNEDKTVMSRFTMGNYAGTTIFSQGGYSKFAEVLKKVKEKKGPDRQGEFDSIRGMFSGG